MLGLETRETRTVVVSENIDQTPSWAHSVRPEELATGDLELPDEAAAQAGCRNGEPAATERRIPR